MHVLESRNQAELLEEQNGGRKELKQGIRRLYGCHEMSLEHRIRENSIAVYTEMKNKRIVGEKGRTNQGQIREFYGWS